MMESITPEAKIKMSPVIDHLNNRFLNSSMRSFYSMGLVFLVRSTTDNINVFSKAKILYVFRVEFVISSYKSELVTRFLKDVCNMSYPFEEIFSGGKCGAEDHPRFEVHASS